MNATNRVANRLLLVLVGLLLLAAGAAAIAIATLPAIASGWKAWFTPAGFQPWVTEPAAGTASGGALAAGGIALLLAVLLLLLVVRQGRGRAGVVVERDISPTGRARIDLAVPRTLLAEALDADPDVLASRVSAYSVRGTPTLKVSVRARRGAAPSRIASGVVESLRALDAVLGEEVPALVQVTGGFRARSSGRARVQ